MILNLSSVHEHSSACALHHTQIEYSKRAGIMLVIIAVMECYLFKDHQAPDRSWNLTNSPSSDEESSDELSAFFTGLALPFCLALPLATGLATVTGVSSSLLSSLELDSGFTGFLATFGDLA